MTATDTILAEHIALGTVGLILGPVAMTARTLPGLHTMAGEAYHWVMLGVGVSLERGRTDRGWRESVDQIYLDRDAPRGIPGHCRNGTRGVGLGNGP